MNRGEAREWVEENKPRNSYWPCRCNRRACQARRTLPKHPDAYVNGPPKCRECKVGAMYVDYLRAAKIFEHKDRGPGGRCYCDGYHWAGPHRRGSKWCRYYAGEYTDEEIEERQRYGR